MAGHFSSFPDDLTVLIQGASRGLGLALTELALDDERVGIVVATSRHPDNSSGLSSLKDQHGDRLRTMALDVSDLDSIKEGAENFGELDKPLHLLINVAGVLHDSDRGMQPEKKIDELDPENAIYSFRVNALGPLLMAQQFVPFLDPQRSVIANLSARVGSISANELGGWYSYRASKAAQNMFTRTLSIELGRYRKSHQAICVGLHPGTVKTDLSAPFRSNVKHEIFSPEKAARQLLEVIDGLDETHQGQFIVYNGEPIDY